MGTVGPERLREIFVRTEIDAAWERAQRETSLFDIPYGSGGVNPGDGRAIFYLISALKPRSVLEIGTHVGASTLHIALALRMNGVRSGAGSPDSPPDHVDGDRENGVLVSVDVVNVNDPAAKPWTKFGTEHSPVDMLTRIGAEHLVEFVTEHSITYMKGSAGGFDFIFLDGDHSAETVYREIPMALGLLNEGGVILLHDYFPNLQPLWTDGQVVPGPCLATTRLADEGANFTVNGLGRLPWPTKLQSNVTSLALLGADRCTSRS